MWVILSIVLLGVMILLPCFLIKYKRLSEQKDETAKSFTRFG